MPERGAAFDYKKHLFNVTTLTCRRERSGRPEWIRVAAYLLPHLAVHEAVYPSRPALACSERASGLRVVTFASAVGLERAVDLARELDALFEDAPDRGNPTEDRQRWPSDYREWHEFAELRIRYWRDTHAEYLWHELESETDHV